MNPKDSQQSWLLDLRQELLGALLRGAITPNASRRKNAHLPSCPRHFRGLTCVPQATQASGLRQYTKRYAYGRQKKGRKCARARQGRRSGSRS